MPLINFSGLASGIDSEALIEAISDATRQQRIVPSEEKIANLTDENDAVDELKTFWDDLKAILGDFTSLNGGVVTKQAVSSDETVLTAIASNSAAAGTYEISEILTLATNSTWSFNQRPTDTGDTILGAGLSGNFDVTIGQGASLENFVIAVDDTTTYFDLVNQFNTETTSAQASLINVGTESSPEYALTIVTQDVGQDEGLLAITTDGDLATVLGTTQGTNPNESTYSLATNAEFAMTGINGTIERSSNTISDVIQGVTFNLEDVLSQADGPVSVTISNDNSATQAKVQEFIDKYNEIVEFMNENNLITQEQEGEDITNIFGPLSSTRVDDGALSGVRGDLSAAVFESGTAVRIMADLGITTERDGTLKFLTESADQNAFTFERAMNEDPDAVNEILKSFADAAANTGGTIDVYTRFQGLFDLTVKGNERLIDDLNDRIARAEESILKNEQILRQRFARLESVIGQLQSQQQALTSSLAGLGTA